MIIGYARTSTVEQLAGMEAQMVDLKTAHCEKIFQEQASSIAKRVQLEAALEFVREGDVFVVTKLDRLVRSVSSLMDIVSILDRKVVSLRILNLGMDTTTPTGKLMLTILGAVAQFEREMMLERQREGIAKAKAEGKFKGRTPLPDSVKQEVIKLNAQGVSKVKIARKLDIGEASVYRILKRTPR